VVVVTGSTSTKQEIKYAKKVVETATHAQTAVPASASLLSINAQLSVNNSNNRARINVSNNVIKNAPKTMKQTVVQIV
jgi:hypothetical protein